jgi:hypothetical protein
MHEHTAYIVFLVLAFGGLALFTVAMLAAAISLWRHNRRSSPR